MPRLRKVSPREPGWRRVRHGRGHRYLDVDGSPLAADEVELVKSLVIPPAWRDVWISPHPDAHLQAVGTDEAGRRQYLYHPSWRQQRDEAKCDRVIEMAGRLPRVRSRLRRRLRSGLGSADLDRDAGWRSARRPSAPGTPPCTSPGAGGVRTGHQQAPTCSDGARGGGQRLRAAGQHPDGVPFLLRRPARDRPLRVRHHDPARRGLDQQTDRARDRIDEAVVALLTD